MSRTIAASAISLSRGPGVFLVAAVGLISVTIALALIARVSDVGATRLSQPAAKRMVQLAFVDLDDGSIAVRDARSSRLLLTVKPGENGFVRVAMRSVAFERRAAGISPELPVALAQDDKGRLWLRDPSTQRLLYLDAFGAGNVTVFNHIIKTAGVESWQ